jgi:hypothetical protein
VRQELERDGAVEMAVLGFIYQRPFHLRRVYR